MMKKLICIGGSVAALVVAVGCSTNAQTCCTASKSAPVAETVTAVPAKPEMAVPAVKVPATSVACEFDKPGFATAVVKGRLWVFEEGSEALSAYKTSGKTPAVHATRVKAGPKGMTIIAPDGATIVKYMVMKPGFHTMVKDGRLWVFAEGSEELDAYKASGKTPAVHTTRIKAGPLGMTIIAPDLAVLDAYMK